MIKIPSDTEFDLLVHDDILTGTLPVVYADQAEGRRGIAVGDTKPRLEAVLRGVD